MHLKKTYVFADNVQLLTACRMSTPQLFASCTLAGSSVFKKGFWKYDCFSCEKTQTYNVPLQKQP